MKMLFKQRFFSWFDCYDVFSEEGAVLFSVQGKLSWGHCFHILDASGQPIGAVQQKTNTLLPQFELYAYEEYLGCVRQEFALFTPHYTFDCSDWVIEGSCTNWDYSITSPRQGLVAAACKAYFQRTDTYAIEVPDPDNALCVLMAVLAVNAGR